jgi:hypothetical protein
MKWVDRAASTSSSYVVVYSFDAPQRQVIRTMCVGSDPPASSVLANNVVSTSSPRSPAAWCDDDETAPCPVFPRTVTLRVTESNAEHPSAQPFSYTLSATTRAQAGTGVTGATGPSGPSGPSGPTGPT